MKVKDFIRKLEDIGYNDETEIVFDLRLWQYKDKNEERIILMEEISRLKESMQILIDIIESNMPNLKLEQYKKLIERSI